MPHTNLRAHFAWVPVLPPDSLAEAEAVAAKIADPRASHYWDGERELARRLAESLGISAKESLGIEGGPGLAWDVYAAYRRGNADLARPDFWMHQLAVKHAPRLDAGEFRQRVERLLAADSSS